MIISGSPVVTAIETEVVDVTDDIATTLSVTVPTPVICNESPIFVLIPVTPITTLAPVPPVNELSISNVSVPVNPEPPSIISTPVTELLATVTFAVAPSQVVVPSLSNLTL